MENNQIPHIIVSDEELAAQKKQKSRNRVFGILLGIIVLLSAIAIAEFIVLITK